MSKNVLIVEGSNDKLFIERLKQHIVNADFDIDPPICNINDYECLNGLSQQSLQFKLQELNSEIQKGKINKVGILIDADEIGIANRVKLINQAIKTIDKELEIETANHWYKSESLGVDFSCHILNVNGIGELETLLNVITAKNPHHADCLFAWKNCLNGYQKSITDKEFRKLWIDVYIRYDCHNKVDREQGIKKCTLPASLNQDVTDIWDFSHAALDELKAYLLTFG